MVQHRDILARYFSINERPRTRTSLWLLHDEDGSVRAAFGTTRIAKIEDDEFLFTIGETERGKDAKLSERIKAIIAKKGLEIRFTESTNGTLEGEKKKYYVGFDFTPNVEGVLDDVIRLVLEEVRACIPSDGAPGPRRATRSVASGEPRRAR